MTEDYYGIIFMATVVGLVALVVAACSKRAKANLGFAFVIQAVTVMVLGALFYLGAGLQSPPDYPFLFMLIAFVGALVVSHLIWRFGRVTGDDSSS